MRAEFSCAPLKFREVSIPTEWYAILSSPPLVMLPGGGGVSKAKLLDLPDGMHFGVHSFMDC